MCDHDSGNSNGDTSALNTYGNNYRTYDNDRINDHTPYDDDRIKDDNSDDNHDSNDNT